MAQYLFKSIMDAFSGNPSTPPLRPEGDTGTLLEIFAPLTDKEDPRHKLNKSCSLFRSWLAFDTDYIFSLEITGCTFDYGVNKGSGVYLHTRDDKKPASLISIGTIWQKPEELDDTEDCIQMLYNAFAGEEGLSKEKDITIYELTLENRDLFPLTNTLDHAESSLLDEILLALEGLPVQSGAGVQLICEPAPPTWDDEAKAELYRIKFPDEAENMDGSGGGIGGFLKDGVWGGLVSQMMGETEKQRKQKGTKKSKALNKRPPQEIEDTKAIADKIEDNNFLCTLRVWATYPEMADILADIIIRSTRSKAQALVKDNALTDLLRLSRRERGYGSFVLGEREMGYIWQVPDTLNTAPSLHRPTTAATQPPEGLPMFDPKSPDNIQNLLAREFKEI